jgi:hypothetical protein
MRNSISKSIVAGGAGDVDGRNPGVRAMGWRWLTWAFSGQVVRFIGTSKNSGGCFGIQGLSPIS